MAKASLLDVGAILSDRPNHGLAQGQVGTLVEELGGGYEVELSDKDSQSFVELGLGTAQGAKFTGSTGQPCVSPTEPEEGHRHGR